MGTTGLHSQAFSSSDESAIERTLDVSAEDTPSSYSLEFCAFYEIERTVQIIRERDYKRVCSQIQHFCWADIDEIGTFTLPDSQIALQFPDELLHDSVPVYQLVQERLGPEREVYVLADTSYGRCVLCRLTVR